MSLVEIAEEAFSPENIEKAKIRIFGIGHILARKESKVFFTEKMPHGAPEHAAWMRHKGLLDPTIPERPYYYFP